MRFRVMAGMTGLAMLMISFTANAGFWDKFNVNKIFNAQQGVLVASDEPPPPPAPVTLTRRIGRVEVATTDYPVVSDCRATLVDDANNKAFVARLNFPPLDDNRERSLNALYFMQRHSICLAALRAVSRNQSVTVTGHKKTLGTGNVLGTMDISAFTLVPLGAATVSIAPPPRANICSIGNSCSVTSPVAALTYELGSGETLCTATLRIQQGDNVQFANATVTVRPLQHDPADLAALEHDQSKFQACQVFEEAMDKNLPASIEGSKIGGDPSKMSVDVVRISESTPDGLTSWF